MLAGAAGASTVVTVSGLGLDAVNSVGGVAFAVGTSCSTPTVSASAFVNSGTNNTLLVVSLPVSVGLVANSYSVCVNFLAVASEHDVCECWVVACCLLAV